MPVVPEDFFRYADMLFAIPLVVGVAMVPLMMLSIARLVVHSVLKPNSKSNGSLLTIGI